MGSAVINAFGVFRVPVGKLPGRAFSHAVQPVRGLKLPGWTDAFSRNCSPAPRADASGQGVVQRHPRHVCICGIVCDAFGAFWKGIVASRDWPDVDAVAKQLVGVIGDVVLDFDLRRYSRSGSRCSPPRRHKW